MRFPRLVQISFLMSAAFVLAPVLLTGCNNSSISSISTAGPSPTPNGATSNSTVAYVFVTNRPTNSSTSQIEAYAANTSGQLTPVSGSPFNQNVGSMAAYGGYLVAVSQSEPDLNSYKIGSNGALTLATQFNYQQQTDAQSNNDTTCSSLGQLIFDHTGQSLYAEAGNFQCSSNNAIVSFAFDSSKGNLSYFGDVNIGYESSGAISLLGNNAYAYSALYDACMYGGITSFMRNSSGLLSGVPASITPEFGPPAPPGATSSGVKLPSYAPGFTATDTTNHVAIAEFPCFAQAGVAATQVQLATYTADANGNLTTADTYATMPATTIDPQDLEMSPSGSLLAVGGIGGVQVFHFNGANPITSFTKVLTTDDVSQMFWDNANHLYAITQTAGSLAVNPGKLHVFTVTDTAASEAPGSPYTIAGPATLAVQPE